MATLMLPTLSRFLDKPAKKAHTTQQEDLTQGPRPSSSVEGQGVQTQNANKPSLSTATIASTHTTNPQNFCTGPLVLVSQMPTTELDKDGNPDVDTHDADTATTIFSADEEEDFASTTAMDPEMKLALEEDEDEDENQQQNETSAGLHVPPILPGGLNNLGNTCYLASAVQMLAALGPLMDELVTFEKQHTQQQVENTQDSNNKRSLLKAFVEVLAQLRQGETVRPHELKQVLDERSSLFVGYQQQDAHEFVTTLLDIMDEDYKKMLGKEEEEETSKKDFEQDNNDGWPQTPNESYPAEPATMKGGGDSDKDEETTAEPALEEDREIKEEGADYELIQSEEAEHSAEPVELEDCSSPLVRKRLKRDISTSIEESGNTEELGLGPLPSLRSSTSSFSRLGVDEIGQLLHGMPTGSSDGILFNPVSTQVADTPKCKLVGGRMSHNSDRYESIVSQPQVSLFEGGEGENETDALSTQAGLADREQSAATPDNGSTERVQETPQQPKMKSPIESYLTTEVRVRLTCDSCKYSRTHHETYWHLSLELSNDGSVEDGLARFFAPEQRQLKCEHCYCETASQTLEITKLPSAILLHLKRFIVDISDDYTSVSYRKNTSPVSFETEMLVREQPCDNYDGHETPYLSTGAGMQPASILSDYLAPDCVLPSNGTDTTNHTCAFTDRQQQQCSYRLRSVVNHIGMTASCGHYTCDAQREADRGAREWLRFNDSYVSRVTKQQATEGSASTAYLILYEVE